MSKAATAPEGEGAAEAPKKKGKMMIILIAVAVLVLGGGGAAYFMMAKKKAAEEEAAAAEADGGDSHDKKGKKGKAKDGKEHPPAFVNLEAFTVNLRTEDNAEQYLQAVVALKVEDPTSADKLKEYMPEIRHKILLMLSSKKAVEINPPEGREELAGAMREAINEVVSGDPEEPVMSVLFTSFIIQ